MSNQVGSSGPREIIERIRRASVEELEIILMEVTTTKFPIGHDDVFNAINERCGNHTDCFHLTPAIANAKRSLLRQKGDLVEVAK